MELEVKILEGGDSGKITISDDLFTSDYNEELIHQVVVSCQSNIRQGTKAQKNRSDVRGGGAKPWKQKGSGRARAGTNSSPIWRSGGVTFAARPKSWNHKINKKMYALAMRSIMSELVRSDRITVIDNLELPSPKTKLLADQMKKLDIRDALIVVSRECFTENLYLASRNLKFVAICDVDILDPVTLIAFDKIVVTEEAMKQIEERLS